MSITISNREYNALISKSKAGWKFYYTLLETDIKEATEGILILQKIINDTVAKDLKKDENIQRLMDGYKIRVTCCICLEEDLSKENGQLLGCLHRFHKTCLKNYRDSSRNFKCPECRQ